MSQHPYFSVCICTHNPRRDYMQRVLNGLLQQTLAQEFWELIIIDNQSAVPVTDWINLTGFDRVAVVGEERLGLTYARLRAVQESLGEILIFVDDDNVLDYQFLEIAKRILDDKPFLGIIGGRCKGRYEVPPPDWCYRFLPYMAVIDHGVNHIWACHRHTYQPWFPCGAGMVIRREVALLYAGQVAADPVRQQYGRCGRVLSGSEDIDMVFTAINAEWAVGYFPKLVLRHLIPRERLRLGYWARLVYNAHRSAYHLMLSRKIHRRPRHWPLAYFSAVLQCILANEWHPLTWWLAIQVARGRYAAYRVFRRQKHEAARLKALAAQELEQQNRPANDPVQTT
jgi:glycosyltransferase involved in cell wall biosynthesis